MNLLTLKLETTVGSRIDDVAGDLCRLAERLVVNCEAEFNGVRLRARPGDSPHDLVWRYHASFEIVTTVEKR